jgi:hypothetical protein
MSQQPHFSCLISHILTSNVSRDSCLTSQQTRAPCSNRLNFHVSSHISTVSLLLYQQTHASCLNRLISPILTVSYIKRLMSHVSTDSCLMSQQSHFSYLNSLIYQETHASCLNRLVSCVMYGFHDGEKVKVKLSLCLINEAMKTNGRVRYS